MSNSGLAGGVVTVDSMGRALAAARAAAGRGEVPVGALVLDAGGRILAIRGNEVEARCDAAAHAELLAMREAAGRLGDARLTGCTVVVTLEPCPMCAAAMVHFRVRRVVFGAYDPKGGGVEHGPRIFEQPRCLHRPEVVGGVRAGESAVLLRGFFGGLRGR
ncbi:cytosine deaminase [Neoasaia chiangmaiensis NBRC 101099]|uniref:tRNA-specific adenosine deaminase n=1 Tax=Neoasaia chiangmaiensis TaxID=320497 RepID=A0A1U9KQ75_9PROT|nr:nucleoside deaminase [Neoasaia chiangmaiensis]AQS87943.1 tRNA-specific adenosine deaminase [Neoasaia chiangmaiensis]GBR38995.1 cytosine deaminase [Neoasaia chiangmaiensis NBRC 101099]GEN15600.1 tRNA-specific adenosine deaminase [Neoasaia chiangmaiensis]